MIRLLALESARGLAPTPKNLAAVAAETDEESARWAFAQWELRSRAKAKFSAAESMLFVREALEQASHEAVARSHAARFPKDALVADLTTGIGSDLLALAARGPAIGYDIDGERLEMAAHNLRVHGHRALMREEDSLEGPWDFEYAFADPARRVAGKRTLDLSEFSPDPHGLASRMAELRLGGIKLSPMLKDSDLAELGPEIEFVSFGGECREAVVWTGTDARPGVRALHVETGARIDGGSPLPETAVAPGDYLMEADPAAIRAHALGTLCAEHDAQPLGDSNGYLTSSFPATSPWLRCCRVLYHGKADLRQTREALRSLDGATPILKQRGAGLDLEKLRSSYRSEGSRTVALAIWPVGKSLRHTILDWSDCVGSAPKA